MPDWTKARRKGGRVICGEWCDLYYGSGYANMRTDAPGCGFLPSMVHKQTCPVWVNELVREIEEIMKELKGDFRMDLGNSRLGYLLGHYLDPYFGVEEDD